MKTKKFIGFISGFIMLFFCLAELFAEPTVTASDISIDLQCADYFHSTHGCEILIDNNTFPDFFQFDVELGSGNLVIDDLEYMINPIEDALAYEPGIGWKSLSQDSKVSVYFSIDKNNIENGATRIIEFKWRWSPGNTGWSKWKSAELLVSVEDLSISGVNYLCTSPTAAYTINNPPAGSSYSWSVDDSKINIISGSSSSTALVNAKSSVNGESWVRATLNSGTCSWNKDYSLWVGIPSQPTTNPTGYPTVQMSLGQHKTIYAANGPGATNYSWNATGSITRVSSPSGGQTTVEATSLGSGQFYCYGVNNCGTSSSSGGGAVWVSSGGGGGPLMVYPNPGSNIIEISFTDEFKKNEDNLGENISLVSDYNLKIYNRSGLPVYHDKFLNSKQIDVSDWQKGTYHVMVYDQEESFSTSFVVE